MSEIDNSRYTSPVAQIVSATGNFLNNVTNPFFILAILLVVIIILEGYVMDKFSTKIDLIAEILNEQKIQNQQEIEVLQKIANQSLSLYNIHKR